MIVELLPSVEKNPPLAVIVVILERLPEVPSLVTPPVWMPVTVELIAPEAVMAPDVIAPVFREVENKFVELAVVAKKLVVVAFVVVELVPVALVKVMRLLVVSTRKTSEVEASVILRVSVRFD
jgi:hypothetical protein